jgi:signal transduction histidine kinase
LASLYAQHAATTYAVVKSTAELVEKNHQLELAKSELIKVSRQAGMAEIATGVLHNIGNVLNGVNVSANLLEEKIHASNVDRLPQISELLESNLGGLDDFLENDPKGQRILPYLRELSIQISNQNAESMIELESLRTGIVHIKSVISSQQSLAKPVGVNQSENLVELIDDALEMSDLQIRGLNIEVIKKLEVLGPVEIDRHKVIQILLNLLSNAKQAMLDAEKNPSVKIVLERKDEKSYLISVTDNGVGIDPKKMDNIFIHGFTTKPDGHGFGLHNSALSAIDMNGSLQCDSAGTNQGATFTLILPLEQVDKSEDQHYDSINGKK